MTEQPREHAVPCQLCGPIRRAMTWNPSALCDRHERWKQEQDEARYDYESERA